MAEPLTTIEQVAIGRNEGEWLKRCLAIPVAGKEPELSNRLRGAGWRIMRLDASMTINDADMNRYGQWWRRGLRNGFGHAQAWRTTRGRKAGALCGRELNRALAWSLGVHK